MKLFSPIFMAKLAGTGQKQDRTRTCCSLNRTCCGRRRSGKFNLAFLSAFAFDQRQSNFAPNKMCDGGGNSIQKQKNKPKKKKIAHPTDYTCRLIRTRINDSCSPKNHVPFAMAIHKYSIADSPIRSHHNQNRNERRTPTSATIIARMLATSAMDMESGIHQGPFVNRRGTRLIGRI